MRHQSHARETWLRFGLVLDVAVRLLVLPEAEGCSELSEIPLRLPEGDAEFTFEGTRASGAAVKVLNMTISRAYKASLCSQCPEAAYA